MKNFIFFAMILISFNLSVKATSKLLNNAQNLSQEESSHQDAQLNNQEQYLNQSPEKINQEVLVQPSSQIQLQTESNSKEGVVNSNAVQNQANLNKVQSVQESSHEEDNMNPSANQMIGQMQDVILDKFNEQKQRNAEYKNQILQDQNQSLITPQSNSPIKKKPSVLLQSPSNQEKSESVQFQTYNPQDTMKNLRQTADTLGEFKQAQPLNQDEVEQMARSMDNQNEQSLMQKQINQGIVNRVNQFQNTPKNDSHISWEYPVNNQNQDPNAKKNAQIESVEEINEPQIQEKPVLKKNEQLNEEDNKEFLRFQKYQNDQFEKSKLLRRQKSFSIKPENGNTCNKELLLTFGLKLDQDRQAGEITPQVSGVKEKTLCRRNMGTCCTYDEMMSVADQFAETANKFREQFVVLEELFVMFKGTKLFDVLEDLKQVDKCKAMMDSHVLIPKDENGVAQGTFDTTVALQIQNEVAGLFNEMRRYKKHVISTYGNVVCSICSPSESKYFKLNEEKELAEIDVTFANCQEFMDLKDFEIRIAEVYQRYLLPLVAVMECDRKEEDPKVDELQLDSVIRDKTMFDDCFNNYSLENPNCQEICSEFDIKTYSFPGNFFKVSKQMLTFYYFKLVNGKDIAEYYEEFKDRDYETFANHEYFVFFEALKVPKVEQDIYKAQVKLVEERGINITNDYINRIFLEHNQHKEVKHNMIMVIMSALMILFL